MRTTTTTTTTTMKPRSDHGCGGGEWRASATAVAVVVLRLIQQSANTGGEQIGRIGANDGNGRQRLMQEEMDTTTMTAERQAPALGAATSKQQST
jgi:hypothetical protein